MTMSTDPARGQALRRLMTWLSPAYPVGGFSYSHGIEWACESGDIRDAASLAEWIEDLIQFGSGRNDAILFTAAWRAGGQSTLDLLADIAAFSAAFATTAERHLETTAQGEAFVAATAAVWPGVLPPDRRAALGPRPPYPVAVGAALADLPLTDALNAYLQAFAANLVSAGVRLIPLGQTDGLRVMARLDATIGTMLSILPDLSLDDLGAATLRADIASMRHETQYTRLFRT